MEGEHYDFEPQIDGSLKVEKGDTAEKLLKEYGLVVTNPNFEFKEGNKIIPKTKITSAINESKGVTAAHVIGGEKPSSENRDKYMCEECVLMSAYGLDITPKNASRFDLKNKPYLKDFVEVNSFDELDYSTGFVYMKTKNGMEHFATKYGKSNKGIEYVFSKEGTSSKPAVYTLKEAIEIHQTISGSAIETVKFYKFKPNGKK